MPPRVRERPPKSKWPFCGCGCGQRVEPSDRGQPKTYVDDDHRRIAWRRRKGLEPWPRGGRPGEPLKASRKRPTTPYVQIRMSLEAAERLDEYLASMPPWSNGMPAPAIEELEKAIARYRKRHG
jgi:hypothetical protein